MYSICAMGCLFLEGDFNGFHYIAVDEPLSQADARSNCEALEAQLASIWSEEENQFLQRLTSEEYCGPG